MTTDPTASNPAPVTVECIGDVPAPDITVVTDEADNCTANPIVAFVSDVSDGNTCPEIITRTYSVTDDCGNSINVTQIITIGDDIDPLISCPGNINSIACDISGLDTLSGFAFSATPQTIIYLHLLLWVVLLRIIAAFFL